MENTSFFMYLSAIEGFLIVCMLAWEVFWLRRMYQVLWRMPTSEQIGDMVKMIREDRDAIKTGLTSLTSVFVPVSNMFSGLLGTTKKE